MIKIMFVCYGNICRSPMAEFLFVHLAKKRGISHLFAVSSSATSYEEIGNGVHRGTRAVLDEYGIDYLAKRAVHLEKVDYEKYDYFLVMDKQNLRDATRILGGDPQNKVHLLLEYTSTVRDVLDPWYTRDFKATEADIINGINGFLQSLGY